MKFSPAAMLTIFALSAYAQRSTQPPVVAWTRFSDPLEQAFMLEVPKGWTVHGGLYRKGVLDPRVMVLVTSPDGKITYNIGDSSIPPYSTPTALGMKLGLREGSPYSPGGRVQGIIARFRTGTQFADVYVQTRFSKMCRDIQVKSLRKADPLFRIGLTADTAGEAAFTCNGSSMAGYAYAETSLSGTAEMGSWGVPVIYSFLAPEDQAKFAMQVLTHSLSTYKENPQWTQSQLGMIQQTNTQIQKEANASLIRGQQQRNEINSLTSISQRRRQREDQQLKLAEDFGDVINGVTLTRDPTTGQTREIVTTQNPQHWLGPLDRVVSTATDQQPGTNYRKLQTITRDQQ